MNVGKSKVMRCTGNEDGARLNVILRPGSASQGLRPPDSASGFTPESRR